jgi:hypothetical protein
MPGKRITSQQVKLYMKLRNEGKTQITASASAAISERSGREIEHGRREDPSKNIRHWETRKDPFSAHWSELEKMLEQTPGLAAITLFEYLQDKYPEQYADSKLRTLQRRIKKWRSTKGPAKEVIFLQRHEPGRQGMSDFTTLKDVDIFIGGKLFKHLLYHFRLCFSSWSYMKVVCGGESYTALTEGLQSGLHRLGGSPGEHRTDSLSAAYKNISPSDAEDITVRYKVFCEHYQMKATRNNKGVSHENGGIESPHGHLKRRIEQALLLRGSYHFDALCDYQDFIDAVVSRHNRRNADKLAIERPLLTPLPKDKAADYTEIRAVVNSSSVISIKNVSYSVPSRLISETLLVRAYDDRLDCYLGRENVYTLQRLYASRGARGRSINYRHLIDSLRKKPQAFRYSQIRDEILPTDAYRKIWTYVDAVMDANSACKFIVGALYLAAKYDCEIGVSDFILELIAKGASITLAMLENKFNQHDQKTAPVIYISQHPLSGYDNLVQEVAYA